MKHFDDELKNALRREEPSADFTARLLARVAQEKEGGREPVKEGWSELASEKQNGAPNWLRKLGAVFTLPQINWVTAGAVAALLIASVIGVNRYRQHQFELQRQTEIAAEAEGQRAKEQVMFAMRIASAKLNVAQKKVKDSLQHDDDQQQAGRQQN